MTTFVLLRCWFLLIRCVVGLFYLLSIFIFNRLKILNFLNKFNLINNLQHMAAPLFLFLVGARRRIDVRRRRQSLRDLRAAFTIDNISDQDFVRHFRLTKAVFNKIMEKVEPLLNRRRQRRILNPALISNQRQVSKKC